MKALALFLFPLIFSIPKFSGTCSTSPEDKCASHDLNSHSKLTLTPLSFKHIALAQPEGDGATVFRVMPNNKFSNFDPFLMMDLGEARLPNGFPDHPHRGFETVTYVLKGTAFHEDFKGNSGQLKEGMVQWMTAGKGIVHSEMPGSFDETTVITQLWINLPKAKKMIEPYYQEFSREQIKTVKQQGVTVKLIAGEFEGQTGVVETNTPILYLDISLEDNKKVEITIKAGFRGFILVHEGELKWNKEVLKEKQSGFFEVQVTDSLLVLKGNGKAVVVAGMPIGEPVVQHGPFVMNTREEIEQAFQDYRLARNGFEGAHEWRSRIREMAKIK